MYPKLYSNDSSINPLGKPITSHEDSWIGSLLNLGAIVGPFPFIFIAGKLGRKIALLLVAIPHIISYLTLAFAKDIYLYYLARFIGGLSVGGGYALLAMYIAEISRVCNRGAMTMTLNVFWAIGNFLPYAIGPFLSIDMFNSILALIPSTFFVLFWIIGTESPYYLIQVGKTEEAEKSLMLLRSVDKENIKEEMREIQTYLTMDRDARILDILRDSVLRKALIICLVLIATQELGGFCAITYHLQMIFESAGTNVSSEISALIVGFVLLVTSFISPFLVDNIGRRPLIIWSSMGMCVAQTMLGAFFYIHDEMDIDSNTMKWIPIFSLILYITSFNMGVSSIPWTLTSELFPNNVKETVASVVSSFSWIISFITTKVFNDMNYAMGQSGTFWFFAGACLLSSIFSIIFVPETKGRSFTEIQHSLRSGNKNKNNERVNGSNYENVQKLSP
ncbi:hypothetical protein JTB14_020045 [Gonioctena quinquepunctata]|nr:hypothetical protein JTB14_020045 [Gonioctena quinquepunctata]